MNASDNSTKNQADQTRRVPESAYVAQAVERERREELAAQRTLTQIKDAVPLSICGVFLTGVVIYACGVGAGVKSVKAMGLIGKVRFLFS